MKNNSVYESKITMLSEKLRRAALAVVMALTSIVVCSPHAVPQTIPKLVGNVDGLRSDAVDVIDVVGWACSRAGPSDVNVTVYARGASGGEKIVSVPANQRSSAAVSQACGRAGAFRFTAPLSREQLRAYAGEPIYAIASDANGQSTLPSPALRLPGGAGSVEDVAGTAGFDLLIDCSILGGLNCAAGLNRQATSAPGAPAYAYAASIVQTDRGYHMFFCSVGTRKGWDAIRYSYSSDGVHWDQPVLKLVTTGAPKRDLSACDPSVVFYAGYYYMFYGSAYVSPAGNTQTVIQVARSATIDGTYLILSESGRWGATSQDPPAMIVKPSRDVAKVYGAGQPSVVVSGGKLSMWYTDDTIEYPHGNILMMQSDDAASWQNPRVTNARSVNVDVKWNPLSRRYVMFDVDPVDGKEQVRTRSSSDGMVWTAPAELANLPNNDFAFFGQNIGVSADASGALTTSRVLVTYMAPFVDRLGTAAGRDLTGKLSRPDWNLYGSFAPVP